MKKPNILLVDDNPADNEFHSIAVREANICNHLKIAKDGDEALSYIKQCDTRNLPDLIFLDMTMPKMGGIEFYQEFYKLDNTSRTVIIILSGGGLINNLGEKQFHYSLPAGFINKPLTTEIVKEIVEKYF
jgi:CheY-like chemotaxis protein